MIDRDEHIGFRIDELLYTNRRGIRKNDAPITGAQDRSVELSKGIVVGELSCKKGVFGRLVMANYVELNGQQIWVPFSPSRMKFVATSEPDHFDGWEQVKGQLDAIPNPTNPETAKAIQDQDDKLYQNAKAILSLAGVE